jgi:DNA-binding GntR family transcriptional regulator
MPSPAEAAALGRPNGVPVLRIVRLAESPSGRPLEINDTRMDGERWEVGYPITRNASAQPDE